MNLEDKVEITLLRTIGGKRYVFKESLWEPSSLTIKEILEMYEVNELSITPRVLLSKNDRRRIVNIENKVIPNKAVIPIDAIDSIEYYTVSEDLIN